MLFSGMQTKGPEGPRCSLGNSGNVNNGERERGGRSGEKTAVPGGDRLTRHRTPQTTRFGLTSRKIPPFAPRSLICKPNKKTNAQIMPLKV